MKSRKFSVPQYLKLSRVAKNAVPGVDKDLLSRGEIKSKEFEEFK